jgi:hypothetical protein
VFTYEQGTTTPLATYSDPAGGSANTNPVILDAYGRASIYIQDLAYTFLVKDSLNVVQGAGGDVPNPAIDTTEFLERTSATGSAEVPVGSTAQRDSPATQGYFRFNSTIGHFEGYDGTEWVPFNDESDDEPALGNPAKDGLALVSTIAGARSWAYPIPKGVLFDFSGSNGFNPIVFQSPLFADISPAGTDVLYVGVSCFDPTGAVFLETLGGALTATNIPVSGPVYIYIGKLTSTGGISVVAQGAAGSLAAFSSYRLIGMLVSNASSQIYESYICNGELTFPNPLLAPVVSASTTTSYVAYNVSTCLGSNDFSYVDITFIATTACTVYVSRNGTTPFQTLTFSASNLHQTVRIQGGAAMVNRFYVKHATASVAIKVAAAKISYLHQG